MALSMARSELQEQQLRTAEVLAEQAQRASDALTAALALAHCVIGARPCGKCARRCSEIAANCARSSPRPPEAGG